MKIFLSPIRSDKEIEYQFQNETITVTLNGEQDTLDLSFIKEGHFEMLNEDGTPKLKTTLPQNPIISIKRQNGELWVVVANYLGKNATEEERFPDWIEVS